MSDAVPEHPENSSTFNCVGAVSPPDKSGLVRPLALNAPKILAERFGKFLAREEGGEAVGRVLVTITHDTPILKASSSMSYERESIFTRPVRLTDFLRELYHRDCHLDIAIWTSVMRHLSGSEMGWIPLRWNTHLKTLV